MDEDFKESMTEFLLTESLSFSIKETKIIHNCVNPEHDDTNASAFTSLSEDNIFCSCSSCGFYLNEKALRNFLGIGEMGLDDKLKSKLRSLKKMTRESNQNFENQSNSNTKTKTNKLYLPPQKTLFSKIMKEKTYRGISKETFDMIEAYVTPLENFYAKRIIFPMYNYKNKLVSFEAVSTSKEVVPKILRPSGLNDSYFGFENLIGKNPKCPKLVFICEGLFSALSLVELGYNGLINFGVGVSIEKIEGLLAMGVTHIMIMGDKDKAGFKLNGAYLKLLRKSFSVKFFRHSYSAKEKYDSNDYLVNDGRDVLESLIEKNIKGWYYD